MNVYAIYINTHRYDYALTSICAASVRYWYPEIEIYLIADFLNGKAITGFLKKKLNVKVFNTYRKKFGWGYGKLETLFNDNGKCYLVIDADTVLTGPVLNTVNNVNAHFVVDDEVQPEEKFSILYYDLKRIAGIDKTFVYPGYSFNTGQWFGTAGVICRKDFDGIINWTEPPSSKFPGIIFQGEQGHLNLLMHQMEQQGKLKISRKKIMIWPDGVNADFINIDKIKSKSSDYPFIIHWAGLKFKNIEDYPRADILLFYRQFYYSHLSFTEKLADKFWIFYLQVEKKIKHKFFRN